MISCPTAWHVSAAPLTRFGGSLTVDPDGRTLAEDNLRPRETREILSGGWHLPTPPPVFQLDSQQLSEQGVSLRALSVSEVILQPGGLAGPPGDLEARADLIDTH